MKISALRSLALVALAAFGNAPCSVSLHENLSGQETASPVEQKIQRRQRRGRDERAQRLEGMWTAHADLPAQQERLSMHQLESRLMKLERVVERVLERLALQDAVEHLPAPSSRPPPRDATSEESARQRVEQQMELARARRRGANDAPSHLGEELCVAAFVGRVEEVRRLLDAGADVNYTNTYGHTPLVSVFLHSSTMTGGHPAVVALLAGRGADLNALSTFGWGALHFAARGGACLPALVAAGADVDARTADGATPLHLAAHEGNEAGVRALLAARADKRLRGWGGDWRGRTAFDVARRLGSARDLLRP